MSDIAGDIASFPGSYRNTANLDSYEDKIQIIAMFAIPRVAAIIQCVPIGLIDLLPVNKASKARLDLRLWELFVYYVLAVFCMGRVQVLDVRLQVNTNKSHRSGSNRICGPAPHARTSNVR